MSKTLKVVIDVVFILSLILAACQQAKPDNELDIYHWWTAPGEREAADAMFAALKAAYPDITVVENPTAGGGGVNQRVVLQNRLAAGDFPDTWQTLGGAELKNYVDSGFLAPLDDLWKELDYANKIPGPLAKAVTVNGHPYVVPLNMHLQNILYYNLKLFTELGITPPKTFEELIAACETIKTAKPDMSCLGLGSSEKWGDAFVFDSIYLQEAGAENYVKLYKGETDVTTDAAYRSALQGEGLGFATPLDALRHLREGQCAKVHARLPTGALGECADRPGTHQGHGSLSRANQTNSLIPGEACIVSINVRDQGLEFL
jgi:ABC-type glycerol-3-phosphate transport system substrate-binding protein